MTIDEINRNQLFFEVTGEGPPVVLVHGSWGDHFNWNAVVPQLAESFTVVALDRRGHSQSQAPGGQGSVNDDVEDLAGLINTLGMVPAHGVGNSFGASIVLRTACAHPEVFRSLSVHEPPLMALIAGDPAFSGATQKFNEAIGPVIALLEQGQNEEAAELFAETVAIGPGAWNQMPAAARKIWVNNAWTFLDESRDPDAFSVDLEALAKFPHPALLSHGEQSAPFFPAIVAQIARAMPRARVHTFPDAGHVPHVSHPDEYLKVLTQFLVSD